MYSLSGSFLSNEANFPSSLAFFNFGHCLLRLSIKVDAKRCISTFKRSGASENAFYFSTVDPDPVGKKLQKVPHFAKKHEKSSIWAKLATFLSTLPCFGVWFNFSAKGCKNVPYFPKKREKSSIWGKVDTFSRKLPCFLVWLNFLAKSASFREKAWKIVDLAKTCNFFRAEYHVLKFGSTSRQKLAKSALFRQHQVMTVT